MIQISAFPKQLESDECTYVPRLRFGLQEVVQRDEGNGDAVIGAAAIGVRQDEIVDRVLLADRRSPEKPLPVLLKRKAATMDWEPLIAYFRSHSQTNRRRESQRYERSRALLRGSRG